jgi:hypothetical protein
MHTRTLFILAALAIAPHAAQAQQGGTVVASTPGKAAAVTVVEITAAVTALDKVNRVVTLKGPKGNEVDVVAGDQVRNFEQIKVGDQVNVQYQESLTLELKKTKGKSDAKVETAGVRSQPGARPAGAVGRQVTVLADVVKVDQANSFISLKGPKGRVVDLKVNNPDHFKVVKVGDQVEAVYTEALAIAVTPAAKPAAKK